MLAAAEKHFDDWSRLRAVDDAEGADQEDIALHLAVNEGAAHSAPFQFQRSAPSESLFYFSDLAILFLTTLTTDTYKLCPSFGKGPQIRLVESQRSVNVAKIRFVESRTYVTVVKPVS